MPRSPFDDDEEELIDAFSDEDALEDFLGVVEGEESFRWTSVISGDEFHEKTFTLRHEGWTWSDYYRAVRDWKNRLFEPVYGKRKSPERTMIHTRKRPK